LISFTIAGNPIPLKRHRVSKFGGMYDPSSKDKKDVWLQIAKYKPKMPFSGDIMLRATFYMQRPKSHFRTGKFKHLLKENAPIRHSKKPDLDNLLKMLMDTIQGNDRMLLDDSQICVILAEKEYGNIPRTEIIIEEI